MGKVAVVTGASRNIGRAIALSLSTMGATVVINARTSRQEAAAVVDEIQAHGGKALACMADVCDPQEAARLVDTANRAFGRVDIMVCNVGARLDSPVLETSYDAFQSVLRGTVGASFLCAKAALPHLIGAGGGSIVMIGGIGGHVGTIGRCAVSAGKAAVSGLTRALAMELAQYQITVNCVAPGLVETIGRAIPTHINQNNPLGRWGTPAEIASAVCWLCGPGGRYVTGQTIHINGGSLMAN